MPRAKAASRSQHSQGMTVNKGLKVLGSRYELVRKIAADDVSESWTGVDDYETEYLLKIWPFYDDAPDPFQRALWDAELRIMYRVGSSPGADQCVLVIHDAGVDRTNRCFAMVLEAQGSGYGTLAEALRDRKSFSWLRHRDVHRDAEARLQLWSGLQRLANGLHILHEQHVLHRNVGPEAVFFDAKSGTTSFRLGGFEWSLRLGVPSIKWPPPEARWSSPPEFFSDRPAYRPETDWYAFGMLAARCLLDFDHDEEAAPADRHPAVIGAVDRSDQSLSDLERTFLRGLIADDPRDRVAHWPNIRAAIVDIVDKLEYSSAAGRDDGFLILTINPRRSHELGQKAQECGFEPDPGVPTVAFSAANPFHLARLKEFIQRDLSGAELYSGPNDRSYALNGRRLALRVFPYVDPRTGESTWDVLYSDNTGVVVRREGDPEPIALPPGKVVVWTTDELRRASTRPNALSWKRYLPKADPTGLDSTLVRFHDFIRCTNQLELLIRDAEIFAYEIVERRRAGEDAGFETVAIRQIPRRREPMKLVETAGGLTEYVEREVESGKPNSDLLMLTGPEEDSLTLLRWIDPREAWQVTEVDGETKTVTLQRQRDPNLPRPAERGHVRNWGMFGQIDLIRRRKQAIDRLQKHSYLLRSLAAPGQVFMDTGAIASFPYELDPAVVDKTKQAVIEDVLRVRPIYALQGPPGTGKTTLVAHLVREIMTDDPVTQILITAQAHGAVDVLRSKVRDEAFRDVPPEEQPLAIRLGARGGDSELIEDSKEDVSLRVLNAARDRILRTPLGNEVQGRWVEAIDHLLQGHKAKEWRVVRPTSDGSFWHEQWASVIEQLTPGESEGGGHHAWQQSWNDFCELVRRGASLTYCTTSAGDLEELADGRQSFDWSIIEEAGKAHGFDLALPLQAGHRWLLIGDQNQLPPYRYEDYSDLIDHLDEAVDALGRLGLGASVLDFEWVQRWKGQDDLEERQHFKEYAKNWLRTFAQIFEYCGHATGRETTDQPLGAMSGMLVGQYRMHPTIGELISKAYYRGKIVNQTTRPDGLPKADVQHPYERPMGLEGKAILWVDLPWAAEDPKCSERTPQYINPSEVRAIGALLSEIQSASDAFSALKIVVLAPYTQQVIAINRAYSQGALFLPKGLEPAQDLRARRRAGAPAAPQLAYTVDSFQGNQADVVIVSLTRNNERKSGAGLGFLNEPARINVLLSRAQRLLVLVGSWDFFQFQIAGVNPADESAPLWHWWRSLTLLQEWFDRANALKIDAISLANVP
jgi:hypothetical protein